MNLLLVRLVFLLLCFLGNLFISPSYAEIEEKILFIRYQEDIGNSDIFFMDPDGSNQTNLTQSPEDEGHFTVSPDGRRIALALGNAIYTMNIDGTDKVELLNDETLKEDLAWSPDGSKIAFSQFNCTIPDDPFCPWRGWGISAIDVHSGELIRLSDQVDPYWEKNPSWSPFGFRIAFTSDRMQGGKYIMDIASRELSLVSSENSLPDLEWSPDGTMFALLTIEEGPILNIAIMDRDGSNLRIVHPGDSLNIDVRPTWSPDNRQLLFTRIRKEDENVEIYRINIDGTGLVNLTNYEGFDDGAVWVRVDIPTVIENSSWGKIKSEFNQE